MTHRSNQVVASQDRALSQPDDPTPPRRLLLGWATALAALGVSTAVLAGAVWLVRFSVAEFFLGAALAERGIDADFEVINLDFDGAALSDVRFGAEADPDAAINRVEAEWTWDGLFLRLHALRLIAPRLKFRIDPAGNVSAGALEQFGGARGRVRPSLPRIRIDIVNGEARFDAPFGAVHSTFEASGVLGRDFSALARAPLTSQSANGFALERGTAELMVVSQTDSITFGLSADAGALLWAGARIEAASLRVMGRSPLDLSGYSVEAAWRANSVLTPNLTASQLAGAMSAEATTQTDTLAPADWHGHAHASAVSLSLAGNALSQARFEARAEGLATGGGATWSLTSHRFEGLGLISNRPNAAGAFTFDQDALSGDGLITFAQSRLTRSSARDIRAALPDLPGAPVGPAFAQAKRALLAAGAGFEVAAPLRIEIREGGIRLQASAPIEVRARSGTRLSISPLRQDAPAAVLRWPGQSLHGAASIELAGGRAPEATMLLDSIDWAPGAPFEAEGTLTIAHWESARSLIAATDLGLSIALAPRGGGRIDLVGPARVSGPLGAGEVRDLIAELDLALVWDSGWRVTPNHGCLPMRFGGLDAAGLSFAGGALQLCPRGGGIVAANASGRLSGGFVIEQLGLNGRMAGPAAQPARLSATHVTGRFSGTRNAISLSVDASTPALALDLGEGRRLALGLQRLTANAHIGDTWRLEGAFEQGVLTDPNLPGTVSAIVGAWSAAPEDGQSIIRVNAGEALLTANRPATDAERPLFNPMRLNGISAILREGRIDAEGTLMLEALARPLARFTATHEVGIGVGSAHLIADNLVFGETLQPYEITERARGMVENVRGAADAVADIVWTSDSTAASGRVHLNGVSMATSTIPVIQDVRGEIAFDDLFALTTPPGQSVTVGLVNPGVAVRDGRVQFQLLPGQRVSLEQAEFAFAAGVMALSPTIVTLGADETRFELTLRDVDAADLIESLNIADLAATGRVEGSFPLLLSRRTALIQGGVLRALPGGGTISYIGRAGEGATGPAQVAFDALRSFHYDELTLTLDGDLSGEIISQIAFSGENTGQPVDLGPIAPIPGLGNVSVRGVPFDFNVTVTAPFRRLAQTAASFTDPGAILGRAQERPQDEAVDQEAPAPR